MSREKKIAEILLDIKAVALSPAKPFQYTSGTFGPIYTDNRLVISYPEYRKVFRDAFIEVAKEQNIMADVIGGVSTGAIAHAAWVAEATNTPMVYLRTSAKGHGKGKQVEGHFEKGQSMLILEDLVNTGKSSIAAYQGAIEAEATITGMIAILSYDTPKAQAVFAEAGVTLHTLTTFPALLEVAAEKGTITEEEMQIALDWQKDPVAWDEAIQAQHVG